MTKLLSDDVVKQLTEEISGALRRAGASGHFIMVFPVGDVDDGKWDTRLLSTVEPEAMQEIIEATHQQLKTTFVRNILEDKQH